MQGIVKRLFAERRLSDLTDALLIALSDINEKYFILYETGNKKEKKNWSNKKLLIAAMFVFVTVTGIVISLLSDNMGINQKMKEKSYDSYLSMVDYAASFPACKKTLLENIDLKDYQKYSYYSVYILHGNRERITNVNSDIFIVELTNENTEYCIIYQPLPDPGAIPEKYRTKKTMSDQITENDIEIYYNTDFSQIEGEFTTDSGFYRIICKSGNMNNFKYFIKDLLY